MIKKKRIKIKFICIFMIAIGILSAKGYLSSKEKEAIQIAQEYLEHKYEQEMEYQDVRFSWVDPSLYHVYFYAQNNPTLTFEVMISNDLVFPEERINIYGNHYSPDNYYLAYFEQQLTNYIKDSVNALWGDDASASVSVSNPALYSFEFSAELNDQISLNDMEALIEEYLVRINTEEYLNEDNILSESTKVLMLIQFLKESGYKPDALVFRYVAPKTFQNSYGLNIISIDDWKDTTTVEEIVEKLKSELSKD